MAKIVPDSRMPRRLTTVMMITNTTSMVATTTVGENGEQPNNGKADGQRDTKVTRPGCNQAKKNRLRRVGDGGNRIRREHCKGLEFTQALPFGLQGRDWDANQGPFEPKERLSRRPFWHSCGLSGFKHPFLNAVKRLMSWQRYTDVYISRRAASEFLHLSKQDQIKIVFIADGQMLLGSISIGRALEGVLVLLIHHFCSLVPS